MSDIYYSLSSSIFKALSHPTRLQILERLRNENELCVCHIYEDLELEQSNVSQHLRILKDQGILSSRRDGTKAMYSIKHREIFQAIDTIKGLLLNELNEVQRELGKEV